MREPARGVDLQKISPRELRKIIAEMRETLLNQHDPEGVGLAANQVSLPYKIFLARFGRKGGKKSGPEEEIRAFINPEIIAHSEELQDTNNKSPLEGCLSLPKYYGQVRRFKWVKVRYERIAESGERLERTEEQFTGFPAVIIQHEMDHLNGKIFVERILEQKSKLYKTTGKDKNGKEAWEEVEL